MCIFYQGIQGISLLLPTLNPLFFCYLHFQDARHDAFINASAAAKPFLGLASSLGPDYTPFVQQLLENAAKSLAEEHARRRHAASSPAPGAGPSSVRGGGPEGAGASTHAVLNPPEPPRGVAAAKRRAESLVEKRVKRAARAEAAAADSGPHALEIRAIAHFTTLQLQAALRDAGLRISGRKKELQLRLVVHINSRQAGAGSAPRGEAAAAPGPESAEEDGGGSDSESEDSGDGAAAAAPTGAQGMLGVIQQILSSFRGQ